MSKKKIKKLKKRIRRLEQRMTAQGHRISMLEAAQWNWINPDSSAANDAWPIFDSETYYPGKVGRLPCKKDTTKQW
jgi:hypothetical protein